ncbi:MAG: hypothetical protein LUI06_06985 [Ruminococcus sp.]|nr:hypothetical protein [Ruminococcus sp.]
MKKPINTIASFILTVFFICIVLFLMIEVFHIADSNTGARAFIFEGISFVILLVIIGFGRGISSAVGSGMYPPICATTVLYAIISLVYNVAACDMKSTAVFTLLNLLLLFVYFCIVIPMAVAGSNAKSESTDVINTHNIRR